MSVRKILLLALACAAVSFARQTAQLATFENCTLIETAWADGDSFPVRLPDGREQTVRLYGVDCIEMHVQGDDTNARRLRDQRRYFGIADIIEAKSVGADARKETFALLARPFTVHTAFVDGRGDGHFSRVYAFVTTADGADLAETLVARGLARAYGVIRRRPDGVSGAEWRERLKDLELIASRAGTGAWRLTDWKNLPATRREARNERMEINRAKGAGPASEENPVDVNRASRDELISLPGIGPQLADEIIRARPFKQVQDLQRVHGIGPVILERIAPFLSFNPASAEGE